jgi:hypothetical protein
MNGEPNKFNFTFEQSCQMIDDLYKSSAYFRGMVSVCNAYPVDDDPVRANNMSELFIALAAAVVADPAEDDEPPAIQDDFLSKQRGQEVANKIRQEQEEAQDDDLTDLEGVDPDDMTKAGDEDDEEENGEWNGQTLLDDVEQPDDDQLLKALNDQCPVTFRPEHIEEWSQDERMAAFKWAYGRQLKAEWGDEVTVPPCPDCVGNAAKAISSDSQSDIEAMVADAPPAVIDMTGEQDDAMIEEELAQVPPERANGDEVAASRPPAKRKKKASV